MIIRSGLAKDFPKPDSHIVSASQLTTYQRCNRKWGIKYIDKVPDPAGKGAIFGGEVHTVYEEWFRHGEEPDPTTRAGRLAQKGLDSKLYPHLGAVRMVEPHIMMVVDAVWFQGYIDLIDDQRIIHDHKTSSNPSKYGLCTETLPRDTQALIYSLWGLDYWGVDMIDLQWTYHQTADRVNPKIYPVRAKMARQETEQRFQEQVLIPAKELVRDKAKCKTGNELQPNLSACSDFGGCPYDDGLTCVKSSDQQLTSIFGKSENTMRLSEIMAKRLAAQAGIVPGEATEQPTTKATAWTEKFLASSVTVTQTEELAERREQLRVVPEVEAERTKAKQKLKAPPRVNAPEGPASTEVQREVSRVVETTKGKTKQTNREIAVAAAGQVIPTTAKLKAQEAQHAATEDNEAKKAAALSSIEILRICAKDPEGIAVFTCSRKKATAAAPYVGARTMGSLGQNSYAECVKNDDGWRWTVTIAEAGRAQIEPKDPVVKAVVDVAKSVMTGDPLPDEAVKIMADEAMKPRKVWVGSGGGQVLVKPSEDHARFLRHLLLRLEPKDAFKRYDAYCERFPAC